MAIEYAHRRYGRPEIIKKCGITVLLSSLKNIFQQMMNQTKGVRKGFKKLR